MRTQLADKVKALDAEIESKREDAKEKWATFDKLREELAASDTDITDENSEGFQKAHEAHQAYGEAADEVSDLQGRREKLWAMQAERNGDGGPAEQREAREQIKDGLHSRETPGARIVASEAYKQMRESGILNSRKAAIGNVNLGELMSRDEFTARLQASVVVTDEAGDSTVRPLIEPQHRGLVEPRFRPPVIFDMISVGQTDTDSVDYVIETGWTNNAAGVPEAQLDSPVGSGEGSGENPWGVKPQSALSYEKKDATVKTLAHWVAATKKALADVARLRSIIDARLSRGLLEVVEDQIIDGDGSGENLLGILRTPGVQHQPRTGGEPLVNDILRALTKVRLAYFVPSGVGINPLDFQEIRLQRDESGGDPNTGGYLYGPPSQAGPTTIWGVPSVQAPQFPEEQPIVGDFSVVQFLIREGVQVLASDSHADFFTRNLVAVLAEMRGVSFIEEPEGLCEVSEGS
jgi:HK97 family phage major capsid protein